MPPPIIYISSTFRDLKAYREKMLETLKFLVDGYFVVGRTMETMMPGSQQPPLDECLRDVANCNIYLLIFGKRYGSTAPGTNVSFTEHEYNEARTLGKIILPFYADPEADGLAAVAVDDQVAFDRFKNTVQQTYTKFPDDFTTPSNLAIQMLQALLKISGKNGRSTTSSNIAATGICPIFYLKAQKNKNALISP